VSAPPSRSRTRLKDFPVCLQLAGKPVLMVGAGQVAARRLRALLLAGGRVTVVAPQPCSEVLELAVYCSVVVHERPYRRSDLHGMRVAFAATNDRKLNREVAADARASGVLVNVADDPQHCDFTMPAVHHGPSTCVAVSTHGTGPSAAGKLRDFFAALLQGNGVAG
jgi:precorrin-2 dehydrogenase/sirohydrochlorin ferrochelatase